MNTAAQIPVSFAPVKSTLNARPFIVRRGWKARYDEALEYLREELKDGSFVAINADEFSKAFKVTSSFLHLCANLGAMECRSRSKNISKRYRALPRLANLTSSEVRNFRLSDFPNPPYEPQPSPVIPQHLVGKSPEQVRQFADAMNQFEPYIVNETEPNSAAACAELAESSAAIIEPGEPVSAPIYLVGAMGGDSGFLSLCTTKDQHFNDMDMARRFQQSYQGMVGTKIVIVQILDVAQLTTTLQPATL